MGNGPSKEEIIKEFGHLIKAKAEDCQIQYLSKISKPDELQPGACFKFLGFLKGACIWIKQLIECAVIVVIFGSVLEPLEYVKKFDHLPYMPTIRLTQLARDNIDKPATQYVLINPDGSQFGSEHHHMEITTTTTTTTTAGPKPPIQPGSMLVPYSPTWDNIS